MCKLPFIAVLGIGLLSSLCSNVSADLVYDVANDFSTAANPNGVWSYGTTGTTQTGAFSAFLATETKIANITGWNGWVGTQLSFGNHFPFVAKYVGAGNGTSDNIVLTPNMLTLHPANNGEYSVARFTATSGGTYLLNALFEGRETAQTNVDVHVLLNGVALFNEIVSGFGALSDKSFASSVSLNVGDHIDFSVGPNGSFLGDTVALSATITAVPEPGSALLAMLAMAAMPAIRHRRPWRNANSN